MGDSVVILKKFDNSKAYIVAHTDGIRECYWEGWGGPDVTSKHAWNVSYTGWPVPLSITDGQLIIDATAVLTGSAMQLSYTPTDEDPILIPQQELYIKLTSVKTGSVGTGSIGYMYLADQTGHSMLMYFLWETLGWGGLKLSTMGQTSYSNDGVAPIDLSVYGLVDRLSWFQFSYGLMNDLSVNVHAEIDFINFR